MTQRCGHIALLGLPNVGKSTLLNALLGQKIAPTSPKPQTTRRTIRGIFNHGDAQLIFVDTPGLLDPRSEIQTYMRKQALSALEGVDVLVWVMDVAHCLAKLEHEQANLNELSRVNMPFVLVLNKIDCVSDKSKLLPFMTKLSPLKGLLTMVPISAKTGEGLESLKGELSSRVPEREWEFDEDTLTTSSEKEIVAELIREKVLMELSEEIPHQVAVTIDNFDESRREDKRKPLVEISAILHVERESQKGIVVGKGGERIKQIGMKARQEVESVLGCQVMLKLFVRVEPDWSQTAKGIAKLGFKN